MSSEGRNSNNGLVVILVAGIVGVVLLGICGLGLGFFFMARTVQTNAASFPIPQDQAFVQGAMKEANDEDPIPMIHVGKSVEANGLILTFVSVEERPITVKDLTDEKTLSNHFLLTFQIENKTEGYIVEKNPSVIALAKDNFSNEMPMNYEIPTEGYDERDKPIMPGESGVVRLILPRRVPNSTEYSGTFMNGSDPESKYCITAEFRFTNEDIKK